MAGVGSSGRHMESQSSWILGTNTQTNRLIDGQTSRQTGSKQRETGRLTDGQTYRRADKVVGLGKSGTETQL